jgi:glycosyltransferase involved in cell wall biosynthesis
VLQRLAAATAGEVEHLVVSLRSHGDVGALLEAHGVQVEALGLSRGAFTPKAMQRIVTLVKEFEPDVVQGRLHHGNLVGGLAAFRAGVPAVWAVHATDLGKVVDNWRTILVRTLCAVLSRIVPTAIVFDAESSRRMHVRLGYSRRRTRVIDNGIELDRLHPDAAARARQREQVFAYVGGKYCEIEGFLHRRCAFGDQHGD